MKSKKNTRSRKKPTRNNSVKFFMQAFERRLGCHPTEYIYRKMQTGSRKEAVEYLFNILSTEIAHQNNCKAFEFDYFYREISDVEIPKKPISPDQPNKKPDTKRPENAGKFWTVQEEQLLIKMYNNNATKKEMCDTFKRTETGLAARLVKLGIIKEYVEFRSRK